MKTWAPSDVSIQMRHVDTCQCVRRPLVAGSTEDIKMIDARCIAAYLTPDEEPEVCGATGEFGDVGDLKQYVCLLPRHGVVGHRWEPHQRPCAGGACVDPAAHAEGAHEV